MCTAVYVPCTFTACTDRVQWRATAVYIVRPRPCTGYTYMVVLYTRPCLRPVYTASHGRVQTVYTAVHGPRTRFVRDPITAAYAACTRPCTVNTAVFTARVHGIVRTVYTAVRGVYGSCTPACVQGPCTWCVHGHVQGTPTRSGTLYTALFTARVHGLSRTCTDCVHGRARATYMVRP